MSGSIKSRLTRLEALAGAGLGVDAARVHWPAEARPGVRRAPGTDAGVYDLSLHPGTSCPFSRLAVVPRTPRPERDRRPGELTAQRAEVYRRNLLPLLDGRQRRVVDEARFVVVVPPG